MPQISLTSEIQEFLWRLKNGNFSARLSSPKDPGEESSPFISELNLLAKSLEDRCQVQSPSELDKVLESITSIASLDFAHSLPIQGDGGIMDALASGLNMLSEELSNALREKAALFQREQAARKRAEMANEMKDLFLAPLSHELRTPLTTILSWTQLIKKGVLDQKKTERGVTLIENSGRALSQLINDLMEVSRIHSGKLLMNRRLIQLSDSVQMAVDTISFAADERGIKIITSVARDLPLVFADPARLNQVILNLLNNAIKFSPRGSTVELRVDARETNHNMQCRIQVTDHGKGIDPAFLPNVFERFRQEDSSTTRSFGGL